MSLLGGAFALIGTVLLSIALWLTLAETQSPAAASLIVGLLYIAVGCIALATARLYSPATIYPPPVAYRSPALLESALEAFLKGIDAGNRARRR